jgi:hypothetical protein
MLNLDTIIRLNLAIELCNEVKDLIITFPRVNKEPRLLEASDFKLNKETITLLTIAVVMIE